MNKNKIILLFAVIAIISILVAYFKANQPNLKPEKKEILKIGVILPLSGDAGSYGKSLQEGIIIADSLLCDSLDFVVQIIYEDSKAEPKQAVTAMEKLLTTDKVNAVIGDMFTSTTLAIAPIAEKQNILLLSPTGSANEISKDKKQVFRIYPSEIEEGNTLSSFYNSNFTSQKAAIIFANEDAMKNVVSTIKTNLGSSTVVFESSFNRGIKNFKSIILSIPKDISNVFIIGYMEDAALLIKQSKEMNKSFSFFGISTLYDNNFIEITKNAANGVFLTAPFFSVESENMAVSTFVSKYKSVYKKEPDVWAGYGYDAFNIIVEVLAESKSKNIEPYKIMEMLKDYNGVTGLTTINADHSINKQFNIVQVNNSVFQVIKK